MRKRLALVTILLQATVAGSAYCAGNSQSALGLHVTRASNTNPCELPGLTRYTIQEFTPETSLPSQGPFFFVYLIACNGSELSGISGLNCGIEYQGAYSPSGGSFPINVFSWNLCADTQVPTGSWPAAGTNNLIQWSPGNCQRFRSEPLDPYSVIAVAGYFYIAAYESSDMRVIPRLDSAEASVLGCDGGNDNLVDYFPGRLGVAAFGIAGGYNPCSPGIIPTQSTTWSRLKTQMLSD
jgi:hypothetical protein